MIRLGVILLFALHVRLFAGELIDNLDIELSLIMHNEAEHMLGKDSDEKLSADTNAFSSLYTHLILNYDLSEDVFFSLASKTNIVLGEESYVIPEYLRGKLSSDDINQAIISEASLHYDNGFISLNVGRQDVQYDWLLGSIDGALAMIGSDDDYSFRLFWFDNYTQLQYNYYMQVEDINAKKGMYGAIAKSSFSKFELSCFDYFIEDLRNIMGANISYIHQNFGANVSYTSAKALALALYDYDEEFLNASLEYLYYQHYFELGFSQTGKNGLLAMIQMGNFMFGQFYLSNQVDRENAKNGFLKYMYASNRWRFELLGGLTSYDNSFVELQNDLHSSEIDMYIKYTYNKNLSFDLGSMYMNVDEKDPLQVDQALIMLNVVINYENY